MAHTMRIETDIPADRRIEITFPEDVPAGEADVVISVTPKRARSTARELLHSPIYGMWADREDIGDSAAFARALRERAWTRANE